MNNQKLTSPILWVAILGAIKIVLDTVGITIIDNQKVDALANGIAAAIAVVGIIIDHGYRRPVEAPTPEPQPIVPEPVASELQQLNQ